MLTIGIIGYGRIGQCHLKHLTHHVPNAVVKAVVDPHLTIADPTLKHIPHVSREVSTLFEVESLDAIVIASPVETHLPLIEHAMARQLAVFCEKPLGTDFNQMHALEQAARATNHPVQIGFNRRFDPQFALLKQRLDAGEVGEIHTIKITSFDPDLPPLTYLQQSGGLFFDMSIHDFDMVRFLSNSEAASMQVMGDHLCDPNLKDIPDIDTAIINMKMDNDVLATIINSRRASYGYDQRIEVHGSKGMLYAENIVDNHIKRLDESGEHASTIQHFFMDRYQQSYINELNAFVQSVLNQEPVSVTMQDGIKAIEMADQAATCLKEWI